MQNYSQKWTMTSTALASMVTLNFISLNPSHFLNVMSWRRCQQTQTGENATSANQLGFSPAGFGHYDWGFICFLLDRPVITTPRTKFRTSGSDVSLKGKNSDFFFQTGSVVWLSGVHGAPCGWRCAQLRKVSCGSGEAAAAEHPLQTHTHAPTHSFLLIPARPCMKG